MKLLGLHNILETERHILKIPKESEAEAIWSLISENTTKYMIWNKGDDYNSTLENIRKTRENAEKGESWDAAIYDKESGICIGRCGINKINRQTPSFELGYWISEEYYGQGVIPECVKRYLKFAFEESEFEKGVIRCDSKNKNSAKVAEKCEFVFEGEFRNHERIKGELRNTKYFGITRDDYFGK